MVNKKFIGISLGGLSRTRKSTLSTCAPHGCWSCRANTDKEGSIVDRCRPSVPCIYCWWRHFSDLSVKHTPTDMTILDCDIGRKLSAKHLSYRTRDVMVIYHFPCLESKCSTFRFVPVKNFRLQRNVCKSIQFFCCRNEPNGFSFSIP